MRESIIVILFDRALVIASGREEILTGVTLAIRPTLHVILEGLEVLGRLLCQRARRFNSQLHLQRLNHLLCYIAADRKDVLHLAIVGVGPNMVAVRGLDELRADA